MTTSHFHIKLSCYHDYQQVLYKAQLLPWLPVISKLSSVNKFTIDNSMHKNRSDPKIFQETSWCGLGCFPRGHGFPPRLTRSSRCFRSSILMVDGMFSSPPSMESAAPPCWSCRFARRDSRLGLPWGIQQDTICSTRFTLKWTSGISSSDEHNG